MVAANASGMGSARVAKMVPHMLGGSKNLMAERYRREQAEHDLERVKHGLKAVTTELAPQVDELTKAVKLMQIEKHHQLDLDEASQDVLEGLQQQLHAVEEREATFTGVLDSRLEQLHQQIVADFRAEKYELQSIVARVQDAQDELTAEVRMLQHDLAASNEYLTQRMNAVDDAVESVRRDTARDREQQHLNHQGTHTRVSELDEKLFGLDKEMLKIKLVLPSPISTAQFNADSNSGDNSGVSKVGTFRTGAAVTHQLQELSCALEAVKAELVAYRNADRQQFDSITNRMREAAKLQQNFKRGIDTRFQDVQNAYDYVCELALYCTYERMVTKVPSELSKRFLQAQNQWDNELHTLKARTQQLEATSRLKLGLTSTPCTDVCVYGHNENKLYDAQSLRAMDTEVRMQVGRLADLQSEVQTIKSEMDAMCSGQEISAATLGSAVSQVERDLLGLYDWVKDKISVMQEEITFANTALRYFQEHANIQPK